MTNLDTIDYMIDGLYKAAFNVIVWGSIFGSAAVGVWSLVKLFTITI